MFKKKIVRHIHPETGKRVPAGTPGAKKVQKKSKKWYAKILDVKSGKKKAVALSSDRDKATRILAKMLDEIERRQHNLPQKKKGGRDAASPRDLQTLLEEFLAEVKHGTTGKGSGAPKPGRINLIRKHLSRYFEDAKITHTSQIDLPSARDFLAHISKPPDEDDLLAFLIERSDRKQVEELYGSGHIARILGVNRDTLRMAVEANGWPSTGRHNARKFTRETVMEMLRRKFRGLSPKTVQGYAGSLRRFSHWLVVGEQSSVFPLADLRAPSPASAVLVREARHNRRAITGDELARLLDVTKSSEKRFRSLDGVDRWMLYLVALSTGFRAEELTCLKPERFDLDSDPASTMLLPHEAKNGKAAIQPLPSRVVPVIREYLRSKPVGVSIWGYSWLRCSAEMLRRDLKEAKIPHVTRTTDGPQFVDFHGLRHTFIALLKRAGVPLATAMELARHSDPKLTAQVYGKETLPELARAASKIDLGGSPLEWEG